MFGLFFVMFGITFFVKFVSFCKEHKFGTNNFSFEPRDGG